MAKKKKKKAAEKTGKHPKPPLKPKNKKPKNEKPTSKKSAAIASSKKSSGGQAKGKGKDGGTSSKVDAGVRHAAGLTAVEATVPRSTGRGRAQSSVPVSAPSAGISVEAMRNGLAATDQQRVVNNLDRVGGSLAPTQTGPTHAPHNAAFVAHHAGQLEDDLERGGAFIEDLRGALRTKQMMWDLGLARKPRAVTVGRAVHELRAVTEEDAHRARNERIASHMNTDGRKHHLSQAIIDALDSFGTKTSSRANSKLAPLLRPALVLLQRYGWLRAGRVGVYLVNEGLTEFVNFPQWTWQDEEPEQELRRPAPRSSRKST
jgi:hypothetical protein